MATLTVLDPGLLATVQDLGRDGFAHLGVARAGAADTLSLRVGNRLLGNDDGAAAVEVTLRGGAWRFDAEATITLAGAEVPATIRGADGAGRPVPPWSAVAVRAGEVLHLGAAPHGARTYLCVAGGLGVPHVLGSAATHVASGVGGRALRAGDVLPLGRAEAAARRRASARALERLRLALRREDVRAVPGAHAEAFSPEATAAFWRARWEVTERSDRMGLRLGGAPVAAPGGGALVTEGMPRGAVQVPPEGRPILLLPDGPTTGGYPVIACVATVDHPRLGQMRPREAVRFTQVSPEEARRLRREQEGWLEEEVPRP